MGCDIHSFVETLNDTGTWSVVGDVFPLDEFLRKYRKVDFGQQPFESRNYGVFALLADVRNYSAIEPIIQPRGLPSGLSPEVVSDYEVWRLDAHSASWLLGSELLAVDYEQFVNDRRVTAPSNRPRYEGTEMQLQEFLGSQFMRDLEILKTLGEPDRVRVVFWFDN